jgi:hypothetical protein
MAASWSTPRRTMRRLSSSRSNWGELAAAAVEPWSSRGGFAAETGNNQASDGASVLTIFIAASP